MATQHTVRVWNDYGLEMDPYTGVYSESAEKLVRITHNDHVPNSLDSPELFEYLEDEAIDGYMFKGSVVAMNGGLFIVITEHV